MEAKIRRVDEGQPNQFDVFQIIYDGQTGMSAWTGATETTQYHITKEFVEKVKKACDDWLIQALLRGE